jgi:hypothetical protein
LCGTDTPVCAVLVFLIIHLFHLLFLRRSNVHLFEGSALDGSLLAMSDLQ